VRAARDRDQTPKRFTAKSRTYHQRRTVGLWMINRPQRGRRMSHMTNFIFFLSNRISGTTEATLFNFIGTHVGHITLLLRPGRAAKYCDEYVCLFFCLFVHSHNSKTTRPNFCARYNTIQYNIRLIKSWQNATEQ